MRNVLVRLTGAFLALALSTALAAAQSKVTIAVGGSACLCYLPTVLARQLGEPHILPPEEIERLHRFWLDSYGQRALTRERA